MKSMTGYGRAEGSIAGRSVTIELKSVNHRYNDVRLKMPREWMELETDVDRSIRRGVNRGRVECLVRASGEGALAVEPVLDLALLRCFHRIYSDIVRHLDLPTQPTLEMLAASEGVITFQRSAGSSDELRAGLMPLVQQALEALGEMRAAEGEQLLEDIEMRMKKASELVDEIEELIPAERQQLLNRVRERIDTIAKGAEISEERLIQEMAILAERSDVTEELTRLHSHQGQFGELIHRDGAIGRELDFLMQEMNREANTLNSKFHSPNVVRIVVALKAELEKVREQIQNVE